MTVTEMKHLAKVAEWKEKIIECRSSHIPVKQWCKEHNLTDVTYYRWEREIFGKLKGRDILDMVAAEEPQKEPTFVELAPPVQQQSQKASEEIVATIKYGAVSIDIRSGASPAFIVSLCKELQHA